MAKQPNGEFKIEKGVPMPNPNLTRSFGFPWEHMEIGDSFFVGSPYSKDTVRGVAQRVGRRLGAKFATRTEGDGIRVWRIE